MAHQNLLDLTGEELDDFFTRSVVGEDHQFFPNAGSSELSASVEEDVGSGRGRERRHQSCDRRSVSFDHDTENLGNDCTHQRHTTGPETPEVRERRVGGPRTRSASLLEGFEPSMENLRTTGPRPVGSPYRRGGGAGLEPAWRGSSSTGPEPSEGRPRPCFCSTPGSRTENHNRNSLGSESRPVNHRPEAHPSWKPMENEGVSTRYQWMTGPEYCSGESPEYSGRDRELVNRSTSSSRRVPEYCSGRIPEQPDSFHHPRKEQTKRNHDGTRSRASHVAFGAKLGTFDGTTCLETFFAKFDNCTQYFGWDAEDQLFQLKAALDGAAGQLLWDLDRNATVEQIRKLLRCRFGNDHQAERFRAELRTRKRKDGETLQFLYQDICRLMALAYPGPTSALSEIVGRDAFLEALDNQKLRVRILEREPLTLDEALNAAVRLEAFDRKSSDGGEESFRGKTRFAKSVSQGKSTDEKTIEPRWEELMAKLEGLSRDVSRLERKGEQQGAAVGWTSSTNSPKSAERESTQDSRRPVSFSDFRPSGSYKRNSRGKRDDQCRRCGEVGHWARECPNTKGNSGGRSAHTFQKGITENSVTTENQGGQVYIRTVIGGKAVYGLLDTGCESSVVGRRLLPLIDLDPTDRQLFAANGTLIPLVGQADIQLRVGRHSETRTFLISEHLGELILGIDWLTENDCYWDFSSGRIAVKGVWIQLYGQPTQSSVRRIYVEEDTIVPARKQGNVVARIVWPSLQPGVQPLVTAPRMFDEGVFGARTVLPAGELQSAIRVINLTDRDYNFKQGQLLAEAEEAISGRETANRNIPLNCSGDPTDQEFDSHRNIPINCSGVSEKPSNCNNDAEHVQCVIDNLPSHLRPEEHIAAEQFIRHHADVFSRSEFDLGRVNLVKHTIDTEGHRPFKQQLRRHPMAHLEVIDDHVNKMAAHGIVEPTSSPWASNVVLVRKSNGELRFCVDFRQLNLRTVKDSYPLPRIDTCMDALGGAKYFSTLDLRSGYWQVVLDPESSEKTAFCTRRGIWKFNVLAFGLSNAPALFQRLMDLVLAGLTWEVCLAFLDDVIVMSTSFEQQLERLALVFDRLRKANLKLHPGKCRLFQEKVRFLGSIVSKEGISPDPDKVRTVEEWPVPKNLTETRAFVALASYYRRHIKNFAEVARPLHELTRKGKRFLWETRQQEAFDRLKKLLTTAPVVAAPRDGGGFTLDTDASDEALGAVLQQEQDGKVAVISYASRALLATERSYNTTRKELLGIVYGLKHFRHYLLGNSFLLRTDHSALTSLLKAPEPVGQQARWLDLIAEYHFKIVHRPGTQHQNADSLSRRPVGTNKIETDGQMNAQEPSAARPEYSGEQPEYVVPAEETSLPQTLDFAGDQQLPDYSGGQPEYSGNGSCHHIVLDKKTSGLDIDLDIVRKAQLDDKVIGVVLGRLQRAANTTTPVVESESNQEVQKLWVQRQSLEVVKGVLYRRFENLAGAPPTFQLVTPSV